MLNRNDISKLIPHDGNMCLIDKVLNFTKQDIMCLSSSHRDKNNPLRNQLILSIYSLVEYGLQAMAIHHALLNSKSKTDKRLGYLVMLKNVLFNYHDDVRNITHSLSIYAKKKIILQDNMIYSFTISVKDEQLLSGQATIVAAAK